MKASVDLAVLHRDGQTYGAIKKQVTERANKPKIYISIRRGCLEAVYGTRQMDVEIWDWDNIEAEKSQKELKSLDREWDTLTESLINLV